MLSGIVIVIAQWPDTAWVLYHDQTKATERRGGCQENHDTEPQGGSVEEPTQKNHRTAQ